MYLKCILNVSTCAIFNSQQLNYKRVYHSAASVVRSGRPKNGWSEGSAVRPDPIHGILGMLALLIRIYHQWVHLYLDDL